MTSPASEISRGRLAAPAELARYARAILVDCLQLRSGDLLFLDAEPAHAELVVALAEAAFALGADVDVQYTDALVGRARLEHAPDQLLGRTTPWEERRARAMLDERAALLVIGSAEHPDALEGVSPERMGTALARRAKVRRWFARAVIADRVRWSIVLWPTPRWAAQVYPELAGDAAMRRLLDDLLRFCRLAPDDPRDAWARHLDILDQRAARLGDLDLRSLALRGPGTTLDLRIAPGTLFAGGATETAHGQRICANFPTEEIFSSPDAAGTEGTFRCTKPLSFRGRTIDGIEGSFRRGRLERLEASDPDDRDVLAAALAADRGAGRLGEVALVDRSSRIGETGRVYYNTGLDENVASHIAFGAGFPFTRRQDDGLTGTRGVNRSAVHVDVMIGSDDLEVVGVTAAGERVTLIGGGDWQV
jgi:aminopeptidase